MTIPRQSDPIVSDPVVPSWRLVAYGAPIVRHDGAVITCYVCDGTDHDTDDCPYDPDTVPPAYHGPMTTTTDPTDPIRSGCDALSGVVSTIASVAYDWEPTDPASWGTCTFGEGVPMGVCPDGMARRDTLGGCGTVEYVYGGDSPATIEFGHVSCAVVSMMANDTDDGTPVSTWTYHFRQCHNATWDRFGLLHGMVWPGVPSPKPVDNGC